jgi:hypothetical protein
VLAVVILTPLPVEALTAPLAMKVSPLLVLFGSTLRPSRPAPPVRVEFSVIVELSAVQETLPLGELIVPMVLQAVAARAWAVGVATLMAMPPMLASTVEANTLVARSDERRRATTRVLRDMYFPSSQNGARAPGMSGRVSGISDP